MNQFYRILIVALLSFTNLQAKENQDIRLEILKQLRYGAAQEASSEILKKHSFNILADGLAIGAWGTKSPFPLEDLDKATALGLREPYGQQIWVKGKQGIKLHFSSNQKSGKGEPMLFWVEFVDVR